MLKVDKGADPAAPGYYSGLSINSGAPCLCSRALLSSAAEINKASFTKLGKGSLWNVGWLFLLLLSFRSPGYGDEGQAWFLARVMI